MEGSNDFIMNKLIDFSQYDTSINTSYPLVSIVIPCYNDGEYLLEAVNSALSQTYQSVEIIIIDDASCDETTAYILSLISHPRIAIYRNEKNLHLSGTRNRGISLSNGKYILPLDADDMIDESYVQKAVEVIEGNTSIGAVYCRADLFGTQSGRWDLPDYSVDYMIMDNIVFASALFLKSDWEKVGGYSEKLKVGLEDYDFWLSILELDKEIFQIPEVLFYYRKKERSMTTDSLDNLSARQEAFKQIYLNHPVFYEKHKERLITKLREALLGSNFHSRRMDNALTVANETIAQLRYEKELMEQSASWRITRPARFVMGVFRKFCCRRK